MASIGIFALLFSLMPSQFFAYQAEYSPTSGEDQEVVDYFTARNITLYQSTWYFNFTFILGSNMTVLPDTPTTDHQIEFHGAQDIFGTKTIHLRHAFPSWFFGLWLDYHTMSLVTNQALWLFFWEQIDDWRLDTNSSYFEVRCEHVSMNFLILNTGEYTTLENSWNDGNITVLSSYEIDWDAMKPSAFTLITQLITFQNPDFGIPGMLGQILNYSFGIGFWITIAIIVYTVVTRLIPTIPGGIED